MAFSVGTNMKKGEEKKLGVVEKTYRRRQRHSPGPQRGSQGRWLSHPQSNHHSDHHEDCYQQCYYDNVVTVI